MTNQSAAPTVPSAEPCGAVSPSTTANPRLPPASGAPIAPTSRGTTRGSLQKGDPAGHYTNSFGGTSSACPGVAGVAALILARNPALRWDQVREVLKQSCDKIDAVGGTYDASGRSPFYGFGRVNARKAVELALPPQPEAALVFQVVQDVPIADFQTATLALPVAGQGPLKTIKVAVDLDHTFIGDLVLKLLPPAALGIAPVVLHNQAGGGTDNIKKTFDEVNTPALTSLKGKDPSGTWTLEVADNARADIGTLRSLRLVLTF